MAALLHSQRALGASSRQPNATARRSVRPAARRVVVVRAEAAEKSALAKFSDSIGMPTDDGILGFTPFAEQWVGRWAMMGFVSSFVVEGATGKGTLEQIGLPSPSFELLVVMAVVFGGATIAGSVATVQQLLSKKMPRRQLERYRSFLGLTKEADWMAESAANSMKRRPDFASPGNDMQAIEEVRAAGMPADRFLAMGDAATASQSAGVATAVKEAAPEAAEASTSARRPVTTMEELYGVDDVDYAKTVEISNGRAAMLGFLAAIVVEAGTGKGIILQIIMYLKWSGILGPMSGF